MAETSGTTGLPAHTTRRTVVAAAGTAGFAAALAACGGSNGSASSNSYGSSGSSGSTSDSSSGGGSAQLAKTTDIPEGGGQIFASQQVVVTQPSAGEFKGFSAICTHAGCTVSEVKDGTINCPCHGSKYHIADGSVAQGPATQPLAAAKISVEGGAIKLT